MFLITVINTVTVNDYVWDYLFKRKIDKTQSDAF